MAIRRSSTTHALTALSAAALIVSACQKNDQAAIARNESAAGIAARPDTTKRADTTTKPAASNGWTDESILAYLRAEDMDEVKVNELAAKKATSPAVRAFAAKMAADHRAGLKEVQAMSKTKAARDTAAENARDVLNKSRDEVKDLTDKPRGADWDKSYIDMQIDEHQKVLDKLQDAGKSTNNAELKAELVKVSGKVQEHLTKAQEIKATLK